MTGDAITVGWAWGNDTRRTTFDILWSCMTIILVCAYKVMHLNLPSEEDTSAQWWHWPFWRMRVRKLKWMAIMALSPEIVLSQCVRDWLWARQSVRKFSSIDSQVLGQLQDSSSQVPVGSDTVTNLFRMSKQPRRPELLLFKEWTKLQAHYADMGGFRIQFEQDLPPPPSSGNMPARQYPSFPVSSDQLFELITLFQLKVPFVSTEDIRDRSKADVFTKGFAIGQSAWLVIQCITRKVVGLPLSQLELFTLGFVGHAVIMYAMWWNKPFDVERSITIVCPSQQREEVFQMLRESFKACYPAKFLSPSWEKFIRMQRIPNWAYMNDLGVGRSAWLIGVIACTSVGAAFCALHIAAWNWEFPSPTEKFLWRISSLGSTAVCLPIGCTLPILGTGSKWWQRLMIICFIFPLWAVYIIARGILMVQVIISLRRMPVGVYQNVRFTTYILHAS